MVARAGSSSDGLGRALRVPARRHVALVFPDEGWIVAAALLGGDAATRREAAADDLTVERRHGALDLGEARARRRAGAREPRHRRQQADRKSTRLNSSHVSESRMPSSA